MKRNSSFSRVSGDQIFCKYVWLLGKRWSFDRFITTTNTISTNLNILEQVPDADKFLVDLVVELVLLLISASSAMFLRLTGFWLIWLWFFWVLRWVIRPTCLSFGWNLDRNWQNFLNFLVFHSSPSFNALEINAVEGSIIQIPLFLTRKY